MRVLFFLSVLFLSVTVSCTSLSNSLRKQSLPGKSSILAVSIEYRMPLGFPTGKMKNVYFVKLMDETNILSFDKIIPGNFFDGNNIYLINAEPGIYSIIGGKSDQLTFFFDSDIIQKSMFILSNNTLHYFGKYFLKTRTTYFEKNSFTNEAQNYYYQQLETNTQYSKVVEARTDHSQSTGFYGGISYGIKLLYDTSLETLNISEKNNNDFKKEASVYFTDSEWSYMFQ